MAPKEHNLLILGGSSDIGMAYIKTYTNYFDHIFVHFHQTNEALKNLMKQSDDRLYFGQADLSDPVSTVQLIEKIQTKMQVSYILHLAALPYQMKKFHKTDWSVVEREIHVSVKSLWMILETFLPSMRNDRFGKIVVMLLEVTERIPPKYSVDYIMVKHMLLGLVKSLAVDYADQGITINGISPAMVETKYLKNVHESIIEEYKRKTLRGRNMTASEIIPYIHFLISESGECVNGENMLVTCGR